MLPATQLCSLEDVAIGWADPAARLPQLRLELAQSFVVLAEELNITRAAARLFLSQPGLSRRIEALERTVGSCLIERTTRTVRLTAAGEAFLPHACRLLTELRAGIAAASAEDADRSRAVG
jgi:DNA-binding transcriptional LysR family regulator